MASRSNPFARPGNSAEDEDSDYAGPVSDQAGPFAVVPAPWCPHLPALEKRLTDASGKLPESFAADLHCLKCGSDSESWICLGCYGTFCSRYVAGDMVKHYEEALAQSASGDGPSSSDACAGPSTSKASGSSEHTLVLSMSDLSVWCYSCDTYVHNPTLQPFKRAAYRVKFGEDSDSPL